MSDAHCGSLGCRCTHRDGCYKGWMEVDPLPAFRDHTVVGGDGVTRPAETDATRPCPTCRPEQAEVVNLAASREEQSLMLKNRSPHTRRRTETRTL